MSIIIPAASLDQVHGLLNGVIDLEAYAEPFARELMEKTNSLHISRTTEQLPDRVRDILTIKDGEKTLGYFSAHFIPIETSKIILHLQYSGEIPGFKNQYRKHALYPDGRENSDRVLLISGPIREADLLGELETTLLKPNNVEGNPLFRYDNYPIKQFANCEIRT